MHWILFLFLFYLISPVVEAVEFYKSNGNFYVMGNKCEALSGELKALQLWQKNGGNKSCDLSNLSRDKGPPCKVQVDACLPEHVKKYHGTRSEISGPNCWNLSLVMAGLNKHLRYSTPEEMSLLMRPPLCRALSNSESKQPGDVIAIRRSSKEEVHGLIYVSDQLVYSKNGFNRTSPYELQSSEQVMKTYDVPNRKSCRLNSSTDKNCDALMNVYRCQKMDTYLETVSKEGQYAEDVAAIKKLESAECDVSKMLFSQQPLTTEAVDNLRTIAKGLAVYGQQELQKGDWKSDEKKTFHLTLLKTRLEALREQMDIIKDDFHGEDPNAEELRILFNSSATNLSIKETK